MNKYILLSLLSMGFLNASTLYEKRIDIIKKERPGTKKEKLEKTGEPFALIKVTEEKKEMVVPKMEVEIVSTFKLNAIMNERVFLNNKWHKVGDNVDGYELAYIGKKGVVMRKGNDIKKVFLQNHIKNKINIEVK